MATDGVVLVLGAGASAPYGFPLGKELVRDICMNFPGRSTRLANWQFTEGEYRSKATKLADRLRRARVDNIDFFLSHEKNTDLRKIGKFAIASSLLPCENLKAFDDPPDADDDWYRFLTRAVTQGESLLSGVITYNYDRSFEQYMFDALTELWGTSAAKDFIYNTQVIHLHGRFARLPWQPGGGTDDPALPYGQLEDDKYRETIRNAARGIRLMYEQLINMRLAEAHGVLQHASALVFLGFGYGKRNLECLELHRHLPAGVPIIGTALGLNEREAINARTLLEESCGNPDRNHEIRVVPQKSHDTLISEGLFE